MAPGAAETDAAVEIRCAVAWTHAQDGPHLRRLLDDEETARCERMSMPADQARFVSGRALVKTTVSRYLGCAPEDVRIERDCRHCGEPHGKPYVADCDLRFSVSHSGDHVVLAACEGAEPGIDVERVFDRTSKRLGDLLLSEPERPIVAALATPLRPWALSRYWTRKEALLKASGHGLSVPMSSMTVSAPQAPARLVAGAAETAGPVTLVDLAPPSSRYVAALAVLGRPQVKVIECMKADHLDVPARLRVRPSSSTAAAYTGWQEQGQRTESPVLDQDRLLELP